MYLKARGKLSFLSACGECSTELKSNQGWNNYDISFKFLHYISIYLLKKLKNFFPHLSQSLFPSHSIINLSRMIESYNTYPLCETCILTIMKEGDIGIFFKVWVIQSDLWAFEYIGKNTAGIGNWMTYLWYIRDRIKKTKSRLHARGQWRGKIQDDSQVFVSSE